jgi:hypothetical protein
MSLGSIHPLPDTRLLTVCTQIVALRQLAVSYLTAVRAMRDAERAAQIWPSTQGLFDAMRHQLYLLSREIVVVRTEVFETLYDIQSAVTGRDAERCATMRACIDASSIAWGMDTATLDHDLVEAATRLADVVNDVMWRHTGLNPLPSDHDDVM